MTDHRSQLRPSQSSQPSLLSVRKLALMASVVTGLAVYGFSPLSGSFGILGSAAHAQVNTAVSGRGTAHRFRRHGGAREAFGDLGQGHDEREGGRRQRQER